jgi:crossover junction endodeoxyribonuclease RusA
VKEPKGLKSKGSRAGARGGEGVRPRRTVEAPTPPPEPSDINPSWAHLFPGIILETFDHHASTFTLPWPPSINTYWRRSNFGGSGGKTRLEVPITHITNEGRRYRQAAIAELMRQRVPTYRFAEFVALSILLFPPDLRGRDTDNYLKPMFDVLEKYGFVENDRWIKHHSVTMCGPSPGGRVEFVVLSQGGR